MDMFVQLLASMVGALAFGMVFNVSRKYDIQAALGGLVSWGTYLLCMNGFGLDVMVSTIVSAAACQIYAEILARIFKAPTTVFYIPAVVPLVPGGSLYNTMYAAVFRDWVQFRVYGIQTLQGTLGIAIGASFVSAVLYVVTRMSQMKYTRRAG